MSTMSVSERINEVPPQAKARMAGGFFLTTMLTGVLPNNSSPILSSPATLQPRRQTSCRTNRPFGLGSPCTWSNWHAKSR